MVETCFYCIMLKSGDSISGDMDSETARKLFDRLKTKGEFLELEDTEGPVIVRKADISAIYLKGADKLGQIGFSAPTGAI